MQIILREKRLRTSLHNASFRIGDRVIEGHPDGRTKLMIESDLVESRSVSQASGQVDIRKRQCQRLTGKRLATQGDR